MYCQNCGNKLPEGAKFCPNCGTKLTTEVTNKRKSAEDVAFHINNIEEDIPETTASATTKSAGSAKRYSQEKKKKKRIGCTAIIFILLAVALAIAGILAIYTHLATPKNALLPKGEIADTIALEEPNDEGIDNDEDLNVSAEEAALRRRIQNIYRDVFEFRSGANYEGRYCSSNLYQLIRQAKQVSEGWPESSWWTFTQDYHYPTIDYIKVIQSSPSSATVKVTIRPIRNSQIISEVTLYMLNEEGAWLIDDFRCQGLSVKYSARRIIEEHEIRKEIMQEMQTMRDSI